MVTRFRRFLKFNGKKLQNFSKAIQFKTNEFVYDLDYVKSRNQFFICADSTLLYGNSAKLKVFIPHNTGVQIIRPLRVYELNNGLLLLYIARQEIYCID